MNTKIPPPIVTLVCALIIFLSRGAFTSYEFNYQPIVSLIFLILGILTLFSAASSFKKQETTVNPMSPEKATSLVVEGAFKYTRNPMYLAMTLVLIAISIQFNLIGGFLTVVVFVTYISKFQIAPEEEAMEKNFEEDYLAYKKSTRRWI